MWADYWLAGPGGRVCERSTNFPSELIQARGKASSGSVVIPDFADGPGGIRSLRALERVPEDSVERVLGAFICFFERQARGSVGVLAQERIGDLLRGGFIWSRGMLFVSAVKGVRSGVLVKHAVIGVAVASIWFIGGRPRISSMVRRRLVWLYWVLTTAARRV